MRKYGFLVVVMIAAIAVAASGCWLPKHKGPITETRTEVEPPDIGRVIPPPKVPTYLIGVEDVLGINVYQVDALSDISAAVMFDGFINIPLAGKIYASGKTIEMIENDMVMKLSNYLVDPIVTVSVLKVNSAYVYILGEAASPNKYKWRPQMTLIHLISESGGWQEVEAWKSNVHVVRKDGNATLVRYNVNITAILTGEVCDFPLVNGDIVYVPLAPVARINRWLGLLLGIPSNVNAQWREVDWGREEFDLK